MSKKKRTKETIIIKPTEIKVEAIIRERIDPIKETDPKIHFAKYAAKNSVSKDVIAVMSIRNRKEMKTEKEWKELIKKEFSRTVT